jgi:integrase
MDKRAAKSSLGQLQREQEPKGAFVFTSERGAPFSSAGFAKMVGRVDEAAKFVLKADQHMLRHACGYALANRGMIRGRCNLPRPQEQNAGGLLFVGNGTSAASSASAIFDDLVAKGLIAHTS